MAALNTGKGKNSKLSVNTSYKGNYFSSAGIVTKGNARVGTGVAGAAGVSGTVNANSGAIFGKRLPNKAGFIRPKNEKKISTAGGSRRRRRYGSGRRTRRR